MCASKPTGDESSGFTRVWGVCASKPTGDAQGGESGGESDADGAHERGVERGEGPTGDGRWIAIGSAHA